MSRLGRLALTGALSFAAGCAGSGPRSAAPDVFDPRDAASLTAMADSALDRGDAETARRALERAMTATPDRPSVHLGLARYFIALRRYHDAKSAVDRAAALDPQSPEPPYLLGVAYRNAGDADGALASFACALRLDPGYEPARAALRPLLAARYRAAGVPEEYALLGERSVVTRGELAVALAVELGLDPARLGWRSGEERIADLGAIEAAWGTGWVRATVARGWLVPFPDGRLHLGDPVTRGSLALVLRTIEAMGADRAPAPESGADSLGRGSQVPRSERFPDLDQGHYMARVASYATDLGLPRREGGRFEPFTNATGMETLPAVRELAKRLGVAPVISAEPAPNSR